MPFSEILVGAVLATWLACSVWLQRPGAQFKTMQFDVLKMAIRYTLFAPDPPTSDVRIRVRPVGGSNGDSEWIFVCPVSPRSALRTLWNPERRGASVLGKSALRCVGLYEKTGDRTSLEKSRDFQRVMNVVRHEARIAGMGASLECELVVVTAQTGGTTSPRVINVRWTDD